MIDYGIEGQALVWGLGLTLGVSMVAALTGWVMSALARLFNP